MTPAAILDERVPASPAVKSPEARGRAGARRLAEALTGRMSLEEKIGFVSSYFPLISPRAEDLKMRPSSGFTPGLERLGLPALKISDASLGVANVLNSRPGDTATALPAALATAATFDPQLAREGGALVGAEARAKGFNVLLGGGINLTRDPWAGRNFEYLGEDPLLSGRLAGASVAGVQSNHIACTLKHLALNAQETGRMVLDAVIDKSDLRESDLLAFEIALEDGEPASVMTAYNRVNGEYAGEHAWLINEVLKGDWGFDGWVMSDWGAVHSTEKAALAGLDQESGRELDQVLNGAVFFTDRLETAVKEGRVPLSRLDDMVARILCGVIRVGLTEHPVADEPGEIDVDHGADVARRLAEAGTVLLRNEGDLLPLARTLRIAVIGGHADVGVLSGGGSSQVRSLGGAPIEVSLERGDSAWFCRKTYHASSPLDALREEAPDARIDYVDGSDVAAAAALAANADVAVVFAEQWQTEATDAETLALPDAQDALIVAVAAANPRTLVVLETGGPVLMPWLNEVAAVLAAWYPGQAGGKALARIVFGAVNPSGRLPITFPAADDQAPRPQPVGLEELRERDARQDAGEKRPPIRPFSVEYREGANVGYRWYEQSGQRPLFAFGHGLGYSLFSLTDLRIGEGGEPSVSLTVTNCGSRAGTETPQAYVRAADRTGVETWRLAGFARVALEPGESRRITLPLEPRTFAAWDEAARVWRLPQESYPVAVGRSATDLVMTGEIGPIARPGAAFAA